MSQRRCKKTNIYVVQANKIISHSACDKFVLFLSLLQPKGYQQRASTWKANCVRTIYSQILSTDTTTGKATHSVITPKTNKTRHEWESQHGNIIALCHSVMEVHLPDDLWNRSLIQRRGLIVGHKWTCLTTCPVRQHPATRTQADCMNAEVQNRIQKWSSRKVVCGNLPI